MDVKGALDVLALAMEREKAGRGFYQKAATKTNDSKGQRMFKWLASEETKHFQRLAQQREILLSGGKWQKSPEVGQSPLSKSDFPKIEVEAEVTPDTKELDALQIGIEAEGKSIDLYRDAAERTKDPNAKEMFLRLAAEERGHLELLESEYEWLKRSKEYFTIHRFPPPAP